MDINRNQFKEQVERFIDAHPGHSLAVMSVASSSMNKIGDVLDVVPEARTPKTVYVIAPEPEGELSDADVEKVAGGFADKYEGDCGVAIGAAASMTVINIL
jgi:hypothetical protein